MEYQPYAVAQRKALGDRDAEIGIASFHDNAAPRHFEEQAFLRRFPVRTGTRGRPRKSKAAKREMAFGETCLPPQFNPQFQVGISSDTLEALEESLRIETIDEMIEFGFGLTAILRLRELRYAVFDRVYVGDTGCTCNSAASYIYASL